jgi:hypothetical protein
VRPKNNGELVHAETESKTRDSHARRLSLLLLKITTWPVDERGGEANGCRAKDINTLCLSLHLSSLTHNSL